MTETIRFELEPVGVMVLPGVLQRTEAESWTRHASGSSLPGTNLHRRILQFVFAAQRELPAQPELPDGYQWYDFRRQNKDPGQPGSAATPGIRPSFTLTPFLAPPKMK